MDGMGRVVMGRGQNLPLFASDVVYQVSKLALDDTSRILCNKSREELV